MTYSRSAYSSEELSIIVVDDARFSCEMIRRALVQAGFTDIRVASSAAEALAQVRERRANILIADWLMPEMDGLTLTAEVRDIDEETGHYTYIILLTAKEGIDAIAQAFDYGVDDFINKSPGNRELLARVHSAGHICGLRNELLKTQRRLMAMARQLEEQNSFDTVTGLGNRSYLERQLDNTLRHVESRGGAVCCGVVAIDDLAGIEREHGSASATKVLEAVANRLLQSVRPLDVVARIDDSRFGLLMYQENVQECHPHAFRRIHQVLNLRAYKTAAGFLSVGVGISLVSIPSGHDSRPAPSDVMALAESQIEHAQAIDRVHLVSWPEHG